MNQQVQSQVRGRSGRTATHKGLKATFKYLIPPKGLKTIKLVRESEHRRVYFHLLHTEQRHWVCRHRLVNRHRGHGFDEDHASLLQRQRGRQGAGQGAATLRSLRGSEGVSWAGDQAQVLQGEVEDGRTGAVEVVSLLRGARRVGSSRSVEAKAGGCHLLDRGRSGACGQQNKKTVSALLMTFGVQLLFVLKNMIPFIILMIN